MSPRTYDVAIVGGGIVGMATADALLDAGIKGVVVLEAEDRVAAHQTGHNSGVIHSGLYYRPGSLKARYCVEGRDALYAFCDEHDVPVRRCGKLVVAITEAERAMLAVLAERAKGNGLRGVESLDADEIRRIEPEVAGCAGLWVAETGVVDFTQVTRALADRVHRRGGEVLTSQRVVRLSLEGAAMRVATTDRELLAAAVVNCAGLQSDRVARLAGVDPGVAIIPFRGAYYELRAERSALVRNLVYPVPDPSLPFLGVHFTRRINGRVEAGPNAVLALRRDGYAPWAYDARDVAQLAAYPGFWRMAARHWRTGCAELARSASKTLFVRALQRLVPRLRAEDLIRGGAGVRAQAVDREGRLLDDFHIIAGARSIHVVNAPSPAATAALRIGQHVARQAVDLLSS